MNGYFSRLLASLLLCFAASHVSAQPTQAPTADGFRGVWYEITNGSGSGPEPWHQNKYGGGMATYPQQHAPIAIYASQAEKTFFVYGGARSDNGRLQHMISYYDHQTGLLARPRVWLDDNNTTDAHDNPTLAIDGQGHLIMLSNAHGNARRSYIRRSDQPYSIDGYTGLLSRSDPRDTAVFGSNVRVNYGQPWYLPGRDQYLLLHTRYDGSDRNLYTTTSTDADIWTTKTPFAQMEKGQYQISWRFGDTVATAFNMHPAAAPGAASDYRTNLYYLQTDDAGQTWQTADGSTLSPGELPLTHANNAALVADYQSQGKNVYLKDVQQDAAGNPVLLFLTSDGPQAGPENGPHRLHTAQFNPADDQWVIRDVLTTDHNYDHGSLLISSDESNGEVWKLIGPHLQGPQEYATGGNVGVWTSTDQGITWSLDQTLTDDTEVNHSYVRRVLDGDDEFVALWGSGNAWEPSEVGLYFTNAAGEVFQMPETFTPGQDFAAPVRVFSDSTMVPEPGAIALVMIGAGMVLRRRPIR